jgi:hypothetical protein
VLWCACSCQAAYATARTAIPFDRIAASIRKLLEGAGLTLIGLGPGDGRDEVKLAQYLLDELRGRLSLNLLDISSPLLSLAMQHAKEAFVDRDDVSIFGVHGDFHHLPLYQDLFLHSQARPRRRLITMFGGTFANLQNEIRFVCDNLIDMASGDLFLFDATTSLAEELRDATAGRINTGFLENGPYCNWLTHQFESHYKKRMKRIELRRGLDRTTTCPVPGSYAMEIRAHVQMEDGTEKDFSVLTSKRYELAGLVGTMRDNGWELVESWRFDEAHRPRLMCLFVKR